MTPRPGDVWTPRQDVEASGGARRVDAAGQFGVAWTSATDTGFDVIDGWHAWVARHAATPEGVEMDPNERVVIREPLIPIAPDARKGKPPCGECRLRPGETCDICGAEETTPPRAASDAEAHGMDAARKHEDEAIAELLALGSAAMDEICGDDGWETAARDAFWDFLDDLPIDLLWRLFKRARPSRDAALLAMAREALRDARAFVQAEYEVRVDSLTVGGNFETLADEDGPLLGEALACLSRIDVTLAALDAEEKS